MNDMSDNETKKRLTIASVMITTSSNNRHRKSISAITKKIPCRTSVTHWMFYFHPIRDVFLVAFLRD